MNLKTKIGKIKLKNAILVASGTFGYGEEFKNFFDLKKLGGIVTKTITLNERLGNPPPRIVETPSGMLNAIGLQNPGVDKFIVEKLPYFRKIGTVIIVSVMGYTTEELEKLVKILEGEKGIDGYEINLSCPNVSYKTGGGDKKIKVFSHDPVLIAEAVSRLRKVTDKTLIAKLSPDVSDIGLMAKAAENAGADAVTLVNTFLGMVIDVKKKKPVLGNKTGGLSGPCIRPLAVRMVWEASQAVKIPIIGVGGIMTSDDALQFMMAGASAVQIGTANFINPRATMGILAGVSQFLKREKMSSVSEIIGLARSQDEP